MRDNLDYIRKMLDDDVDNKIPKDIKELAIMLLDTADDNPEISEPMKETLKDMLKDYTSWPCFRCGSISEGV